MMRANPVRSGCLWGALALLAGGQAARADVKLPALFSDHMVLQRGTSVPVWGWADPGETVTVTLAGQTRTAIAAQNGQWSVKLGRLNAGELGVLTVRGKNTLTVNDVFGGEVWLGSGQSNMAMTVNRCLNFEQEQAAAKFPLIRVFTVARKAARNPEADCVGSWKICSPETVGQFSATAYFFGRELHQKLNVPVGLINSSVGGTPIEAWTSMEVQQSRPELQELLDSWRERTAKFNMAEAMTAYNRQVAAYRANAARAEGRAVPRAPQKPGFPASSQNHPAVLYNGMIAPLLPYALRGAIWYQGEANAGSEARGALYEVQLPLLIQDWRARWGQGEFPFAWVQLPNFQTRATGWPRLREAMLKTLVLPNTGMTVNTDIGELNDIHPRNKQEIGRRLSLWARAAVYGEEIPYSAPLPAGHRVHGSVMEVRFRHAVGLTAKDGEPRGFEIAGADRQWKPATAKLVGDRVLLSSPEVKVPVAARYAWAANPEGNLFNGAGLPASPFRTDNW